MVKRERGLVHNRMAHAAGQEQKPSVRDAEASEPKGCTDGVSDMKCHASGSIPRTDIHARTDP